MNDDPGHSCAICIALNLEKGKSVPQKSDGRVFVQVVASCKWHVLREERSVHQARDRKPYYEGLGDEVLLGVAATLLPAPAAPLLEPDLRV